MKNKIIEQYLEDINKALLKGDATEHTHRPTLKKLVEGLGDKITATNEPKRIDCGAPDFIVSRRKRNIEQPFGYIECKDIGTDLKKEEKKDQLKRYFGSLHNLILTDYISFRLYIDGDLQESAILAREGKGGKFQATEQGIEAVIKLFAMFFLAEALKVSSAKELAEKMAGIARLLRDMIQKTFRKEGEHGALHGQYEAFKKVLLHDLKEDEFSDMYAQTICYGLFAARCHLSDQAIWGKDIYAAHHGIDGKAGEFTREKAAYLLPKTNPFLRNIFGDIAGPGMDDRIAWLVDDLVELLRNAQMDKVLQGFARTTKRTDPVVHFYETFLAAYDPKLRESRGVYYTPEPVVSYIVRSVDWLLKEKFGLRQGLADNSKITMEVKRPAKNGKKIETSETKSLHRCLILDPAAGTGTFLFEVIHEIYKKFSKNKGTWNSYVNEHLLPRLFGFELMMAPYAICHMKLGLELANTGYDFDSDERLGVYLTNTLEEAEEMSGMPLFTQWLAEEARAANRVKKDLPIMVVLGNPPYSGHSANKGEWIGKLVRDYYFVDDKPLGEKNPKWLQDDYVKFIRYGQHRIEQTGSGILAFITNHGYLDNPTFRGMRQQLMKTFSEIYILDLHGNAKKKEVCPDGSEDKNVFDIQQGVSIGIFVKEAGKKGDAKVYHSELWGDRKEKYDWLNKNEIRNINWKVLDIKKPYYLYLPKDRKTWDQYNEFCPVTNLFPLYASTVTTARNHFSLDYSEDILKERIDDLINKDNEDDYLHNKYLLKDVSYWKLKDARKELFDLDNPEDFIKAYCYRPFDFRYVFYHKAVCERLREEVMCHMMRENLSLLTHRPQSPSDFSYAYCSSMIGDQCVAANKTGGGGNSFQFPLYLYPVKKEELFEATGGAWGSGKGGRIPNLSKEFVEELADNIRLEFITDGAGDLKKAFGPEDIFGYIYGVLHSPEYRKRYAEFLKIDFPRIPIPKNRELFVKICRSGQELVGLHLMESAILEDETNLPKFPSEGDMAVESGYPKYDAGRVYINQKQYFESVAQEIWEFHIGGYQVCEKWLKDRRGRILSYDDINHYKKITVALGETIKLMSRIDETIESLGGWPISE